MFNNHNGGNGARIDRSILTQTYLKTVAYYNGETGKFYRLQARRGSVAGSEMGTKTKSGYIRIMIDKVQYAAASLAVLYVEGHWPNNDVDHKDRNRSNNAFSNLRSASRSQNLANTGLRSCNTSGFKGVSFHKGAGRWMAYINKDSKRIYLGLFDSPTEAASKYRKVARELYGQFSDA